MMHQQFLNDPTDVQWLKETALKGVPGLPPFQSFVIIGNEDAPEELHLYASADPLYTDGFTRVDFSQGAPIYCEVSHCKGE
jgi:hypothetical protein